MMHKRPIPFDTLSDPANLMKAWRKVRANRGAAGVDQMTIAEFERNLQVNLESLSTRLREGRYYPMPVRTMQMRKASGGMRTLGILTVEDRIVQRAALDAIEPLFEPAFLDCSYGFRPNRSVEMAVQRIMKFRADGDAFIVDADIADCFGSLDHDLLMKLVSARIRDKRLLALIGMWLDTGQVLPASLCDRATQESATLFHRATEYLGGSIDAAIAHLLDERGYGSYGYAGYMDYTAGTIDAEVQEISTTGSGAGDAVTGAHRLARKEALKRLGRDGILLLLTYSNRARRLLSPTAIALTGAAALTMAAYPVVSRAFSRRLSARAARLGAVQGGSLSPLLSNIYLHEFDVTMTRAGLHLVRYADDWVILCRDEAQAREALVLASRKLAEMHLRLHPEKTRITRFDDGFIFLGYQFGAQAAIRSGMPPVPPPQLAARIEGQTTMASQVWAKLSPAVKHIGKDVAQRSSAGWFRLRTFMARRKRKGES